jgi:hypothetical protein
MAFAKLWDLVEGTLFARSAAKPLRTPAGALPGFWADGLPWGYKRWISQRHSAKVISIEKLKWRYR